MLLHGLGTTQQIWSLVTEPLAASRRVITVDLPGFGASAPAGEGFDLDEVTDRLARALAAHHVTVPFDLVGHSLGGAVALTLAGWLPSATGPGAAGSCSPSPPPTVPRSRLLRRG